MNYLKNKKESFRNLTKLLFGVIIPVLFLFGASGLCFAQQDIQNEVVSFLANVNPNQKQKVFTIVIGDEQVSTEKLNNLLKPKGGKVLIVTSITAFHITPKKRKSFSVVGLLAVSNNGATRGWGAGTLSVNEKFTTHISYHPGLIIKLMKKESLAIANYIQSNELVRVEIHGFLMKWNK